jgi:hypothetical protein
MPVKRFKHLLSIILSTQNGKQKHCQHQKHAFIVFENKNYDYIIIDVPAGYAFDKRNIDDDDNPIVEHYLIEGDITEKFLKKRTALLNRRHHSEKRRKKN